MRKILSSLVILLCSAMLSAQMVEPIHWQVKQDGQTLTLTAKIDNGWHMYALDMPEDAPPSLSLTIGEQSVPLQAKAEPIEAYDEMFELVLRYYEQQAEFEAVIPANATGDAAIHYFACNDMSCMPGEFTFAICETGDASRETGNSNHGLWWIFLMGLLGGLLAIFTPCVWPMIPMTVSFFIKRRSGWRSAVLYGLSIVLIYVGLGLLITLIFGASALNSLSTNAVVNLLFFALLILFAASFFGAFELTLPSSWSTKLDQKARNTTGFLSLLLMAFVLVIVSFSCTGPIIGTLLVEAAGRSLLAPTLGMLGFALALALPFSLFALFPNMLQKLPKSGGWMNRFKVTLAFLELALSLKFFSVADLAYGWHLLDRETFIALWVVMFALLGCYLLGWIRFPHDDEREHISVTSFMLAVISLAFSIYLLPGLWGAPLKAVSAFVPPMYTQDWTTANRESGNAISETGNGKRVSGATFEALLQAAEAEGKTLLIDFSGYGCVNCRKLEAKVLSDERVETALANYYEVTVFVDDKAKLDEPITVTENGKERKLKTIGDYWSYIQRAHFQANAQPYLVQVAPDGTQIGEAYTYNDNVEDFLLWIKD